MSFARAGQEELEDRWLKRLQQAKANLDFRRGHTWEVRVELDGALIPAQEGNYAYRTARRAESVALAEYRRVLCVLTDLVAKGKIPEDE